ncbi:GNAT family N-acetyltransferase [Noviherbaspirillum sedimenti]|uniref:GNAT family N-acetyltransferase n=1 Tax=Noviherbaspirillum sedimenti TaxID=2320865 RepID=A0A3A3G2M5_9BURK|nr:GNAT family N-acetyltransferase [Noviherbaspirillum sedimenti]RJG01905.1 GNAT family N-acetyltransferase [Noviherbaspirillum sedimenti]
MNVDDKKLQDAKLHIALEQIDADSWEALCRAVPVEVALALQLSVERQGNVVISHCLVADAPLGNRAIALGLGASCTREQILTLAARFRATGMRNFALQISPHARPAELEQWLAEAGLVLRGYSVKLVRDNAPLQGNDWDIRLIGLDDKALFGDVSARGFERPPIVAHWMAATVGLPRWRHYLAFVDGQPAGAAAMYVDNDVAWLGIGSTLPAFRQRGVQQALIARRIADGIALGMRYFVAETESFNTSCQNLMRAGFSCAYERPNYGVVVQA